MQLADAGEYQLEAREVFVASLCFSINDIAP